MMVIYINQERKIWIQQEVGKIMIINQTMIMRKAVIFEEVVVAAMDAGKANKTVATVKVINNIMDYINGRIVVPTGTVQQGGLLVDAIVMVVEENTNIKDEDMNSSINSNIYYHRHMQIHHHLWYIPPPPVSHISTGPLEANYYS